MKRYKVDYLWYCDDEGNIRDTFRCEANNRIEAFNKLLGEFRLFKYTIVQIYSIKLDKTI